MPGKTQKQNKALQKPIFEKRAKEILFQASKLKCGFDHTSDEKEP